MPVDAGIRVTSPLHRAAFRAGTVPEPEEVRAGIMAVPLAMPLSPMPFSLCYLIDGGEGDLHVIDGGVDSDENWKAFLCVVAGMGYEPADIASITVTHAHRDHIGFAARVRRASGAKVLMHEVDAHVMRMETGFMPPELLNVALGSWCVPEDRRDELREGAARPVTAGAQVDVDDYVSDGEQLRMGKRRWRIVHTPGHTRGHVCIVDDDEGLVFSGDHVLPVINPGIALGGRVRGDDPLTDYITSLHTISEAGDYEVCPGHGNRFVGLAERCKQIEAHHSRRGQEVAAAQAAIPGGSVWETASHVAWSGGWENLRGVHLLFALAQTSMHIGRQGASSLEGDA